MISPMTPPGTKVIVIENPWVSVDDSIKVFGLTLKRRTRRVQHMDKGRILTVLKIQPSDKVESGFVADVAEEQGWWFCLSMLRYLDLPKSITDCLTSQPLLVDELTGEATGDKCAPPVVTARGLR